MVKRSGEILVSPDGGETVYVQKKNGERGRMVSQSQLAKDIETAYDEQDMIGEDAVKIRRENPTLQNAWNRYVTIWHLINDNEE
jgi:hypothetical protein|tara:strand:+ start:186 stop:437 length:252 start_codon:yes stop_codon:yes gene_type:complete